MFVIDFGDTKLPEKLVKRLARYNESHADAIKELWIWDAQGMRQILSSSRRFKRGKIYMLTKDQKLIRIR